MLREVVHFGRGVALVGCRWRKGPGLKASGGHTRDNKLQRCLLRRMICCKIKNVKTRHERTG